MLKHLPTPSAFCHVLWWVAVALSAVSSRHVDAQQPPANGYRLIWTDEFNGGALDRTRWCTRYAHGGGLPLQINHRLCTGPGGFMGTGDFLQDERQRYRDYNALGEAMHVVSHGTLKLRCTKTGSDGYAAYESAMIRSMLAIAPSPITSYFVSARIRLPNVRGSFPALWLASGYGTDDRIAWPPEIDIIEGALNEGEDRANMLRVGTIVRGAQTRSGAEELTWYSSKFDKSWHNFIAERSLRDVWLDVGLEWTHRGVCTYINGELTVCQNYRWVDNAGGPVNPANILFNLAVGGEWAGRYGVDDSQPMQLEIDYVRVYSKQGLVGVPTPLPGSHHR